MNKYVHTPLHSESMIICYHFSKVMIIAIHHEGEGKSMGKVTWIQCKSMTIYLMNYYICVFVTGPPGALLFDRDQRSH